MTTETGPRLHKPEAPELPLLLTIDELAELLRVDRRTVERWAQRSMIPGRMKMPGGRTVRYKRDLVLAWIDAGCPKAKTTRPAQQATAANGSH